MKNREFKVVSEGKEIATISCGKDGMTAKATQAGRELLKEFKDCC